MHIRLTIMPLFTHEEKLRILRELIRISGADAYHPAEEYDLLHKITERFQVEPMEMEALFLSEQPLPLPKKERARIHMFYLLIEMMVVDGEIVPDECNLLRDLSMTMALPMQAVNEVLRRSELYLPGRISFDEVVEVFRIHQN